MQRFVHNLAMAVVLCHVLAGCCGHHAHGECAAPAAKTAYASGCCGAGHEHSDHGEFPGDRGPGQNDGCDGPECVFVVPQTEDASEMLGESIGGFVVPSNWDAPSSSYAGLTVWPPPPEGARRPRLHLVHQVFLI